MSHNRGCEVPQCRARRITARLCQMHTVAWTESGECHEGNRRKDFQGAYDRWLKRVTNGTGHTP
jgi:hypothetical protein